MKKNIVLIGMPGCGKSSVGRELAAALHMVLIDTDHIVEQAAGRTIPEIFEQDGEAAFRDLESRAALQAASMEGVIIATGGGMVLRKENMQALSRTGIVFFRDRALSEIAGEDLSDRPLLADNRSRLQQLYDQRIGLYRQYADHVISDTDTAAAAAEQIAAIYKRECSQ